MKKISIENKNGNIIFIIILAIIIFIVFLSSSYYKSLKDLYKSDYYELEQLRYLEVRSKEEIIKPLEMKSIISNDDNVVLVTEFYNYMTTYLRNDMFNKDYGIYLYVANNNTLPKLVKGVNFPNNEGNYLICPQKFYPSATFSTIDRFVSINDLFAIEDYLNKKIQFDYKSLGETLEYTKEFTLVGLYENKNHIVDESICYINESAMKKIQEELHIDAPNIVLSDDDFLVVVDDYKNVDKVIKKFENLNFSVHKLSDKNPIWENKVLNQSKKIVLLSGIVCIGLILVFINKKFFENKTNYQLLYFLGYSKFKVFKIYFFTNIFNFLKSFLIAILIVCFIYFCFNICLNYYPYLFDKMKFIINYNWLILFIITCFIVIVMNLLFNLKFLITIK